ncbi:hypothetical protein LTR84_000257 [Exophiala bonariae]|uniref:Protein kinase domain-containing protein n=1 Tax=Exophiala bonariae TaxID=1690606 RepID=A0AAV9NQ07_9EURO|nr:hypothetical protein LTR84_000257 [Exophiala bonariae]
MAQSQERFDSAFEWKEEEKLKFANHSPQWEWLERNSNSGYHPVTIGDTFSNGRYSVVHKLGKGSNGTVWLVRDAQVDRLMALKILTGSSTFRNRERGVYEFMYDQNEVNPCFTNFLLPQHSFLIQGPNGFHFCLVFRLMGPTLRQFNASNHMLNPEMHQALTKPLIEGLLHLHKLGVCAADISPGNVIFGIVEIASWSDEQVYATFGAPVGTEVEPLLLRRETRSPDSVAYILKHAPKLVYESIDFFKAPGIAKFLKPELEFIDLGEGFLINRPPLFKKLRVNNASPGPEVNFEARPTVAVDTFGLASVIFALRTGKPLFKTPIGGAQYVAANIRETLGPFPEEWVALMNNRLEAWNRAKGPSKLEPSRAERVKAIYRKESLAQQVAAVGKVKGWLSATPIGSVESEVFQDLLRNMMKHKPADRIGMEEVFSHPWVNSKVVSSYPEWLVCLPASDLGYRWELDRSLDKDYVPNPDPCRDFDHYYLPSA